MTCDGESWDGDNPLLTGLDGLSALDSVEETLTIKDQDSLVNLSGLEGLQRVGRLALFGDDSLTDLSALAALADLGGLFLESNDELVSLDGLAPEPWPTT